jgi:predicted metal-binding membrane protein
MEADTPRATLGLLQRRATVSVVTLLALLAATGMATGLGQIGTHMPNGMSAVLFIVMWLTMMVAMMFPAVAPIVLAHRYVLQRRGEGPLPTLAFVAGYLAVWTAIGVIPLAAFLGFRNLPATAGHSTWLVSLAGGILVVAGVYQFTPLKSACLRACRNPLSFILSHDFGSGSRGALRAGLSHGAYCLGCCWALMTILVVVGLMNLAWMALLALVFFAEKNWRRGRELSMVAGGLVALLGVTVVLDPGILDAISGAAGAATQGHM